MASNKANTPHPPQTLNSQPVTGQLPVKSQIYRAIAEMNAGFDKVIHELGNLRHVDFLRSAALSAIYQQLSAFRAQTNREFLSLMTEREAANAVHFEQLCRERAINPPSSPSGLRAQGPQ